MADMCGHFFWLPSFKGAKGGSPPPKKKKKKIIFYQKLANYIIFKVGKK